MSHPSQSLTGQMFDDELAFFMSHALGANQDGSTDPYVLSQIERERIAWAVALYYQCDHCNHHHHRVIVALQKKTGEAPWPWDVYLRRLVFFFTRVKKADVTPEEWGEREEQWQRFIHMLGKEHGRIAALAMLAIALARDDKDLVVQAFATIGDLCADIEKIDNVVRDVFRITVAMKAATTKFRIEQEIKEEVAKLRELYQQQRVSA